MAFADSSVHGPACEVPTRRRCLPGRLARSYLARARSKLDRVARARRLLSLCGERILGLTQEQIAEAFDVHRSSISRDLEQVIADLRDVAEAENIDVDALFQRRTEITDGAGI